LSPRVLGATSMKPSVFPSSEDSGHSRKGARPLRFPARGGNLGTEKARVTVRAKYEDFSRPSRSFGTACLAFLLCAVLAEAKTQARASEALQTASPQTQLKPAPTDGNQKLWSQVLKNARVETGPRLHNPAISSDGLAPGIVTALQEQRNYLEAHAAAFSAQPPVNAATRELVGDSSRKLRSPSQDPPCHEPMIRSVNGKTKGVVFTSTATNNRYQIEGCLFGDAPGVVQLEVSSGPHQWNAPPAIPMQLDPTVPRAWSEHELNVQLDPELRGIPDYSVTLVIHPANRRRIELRGCRFVAARGKPQLLSVIPSAWVSLYASGVSSRSIRQLEYVSPTVASDAVPEDAGASAFVARSDPEQFGIGRDHYDFSHLNRGWVVESVQLQTYRVSCPEVAAPVHTSGVWKAAWTPLGVSIAFQETVCPSTAPASFAFKMSMSQYVIRVWIVGPVGTQPLALVR
jgi:hypothetical protein